MTTQRFDGLFALGREGKRALEKHGAEEITLERTPPKQWEHFCAINDVRIAAELSGKLSYFFACWELPSKSAVSRRYGGRSGPRRA